MLIDLLDKLTSKISKRWLIGRRMVLDLSEANENRVAVVELPVGSFSFDIRQMDGKSELVLVSDAGVHIVATYADRALAVRASKRIKLAMTRPLKRAVWACIGVLIVIFTLDVLSSPKSARINPAGRASPSSSAPVGGLTQEQLSTLLRQRMGSQATPAQSLDGSASSAASGIPVQPPAATVQEPDSQSSPEAQAALRLLKGK
jgi:hypothetical protein